jgi:hypothetical protein
VGWKVRVVLIPAMMTLIVNMHSEEKKGSKEDLDDEE